MDKNYIIRHLKKRYRNWDEARLNTEADKIIKDYEEANRGVLSDRQKKRQESFNKSLDSEFLEFKFLEFDTEDDD